MTHPLASQLAQLLAGSDLAELRDVVDRWVKDAPTERSRHEHELFGARLLEVKQALATAPVPPTREQLELALSMMLSLVEGAKP